ncbi:uracil-DNA glycosylase family protein [Aeromicrobium sp. UC242_57]|uniref:uracil-DNA glycosylase family protein n=1 Tax=Aeromicrobium sp. UC242_57 TaxID=3374624 RepID=UPI0037B6474C
MTRAELESFAGRSIPDLLPDDLRLLFVGINPGLVSAATGMHFARPGNRFYPALRQAGIISVDALTPEAAAPELLRRGIGITNIVARASARADSWTTRSWSRDAADSKGSSTSMLRRSSPSPASRRTASRSVRRRPSPDVRTASSREQRCGSCPIPAGSTLTRPSSPWLSRTALRLMLPE